MARHSDGEIMLKGRVQPVLRGQVAMSQLALQKRWKWSQNKVKRFLKLLKNERMADFETNDLTTIISICNFNTYQNDDVMGERPSERPTGRPVERYADEQSNDDIRMKEGKEGKNVKKKQTVPSAPVDFSVFGMQPNHIDEIKRIRRKNKGGAITQRVANALAKEFHQASQLGYTFDELITEWEVRGWKSFKAEWIKPKAASAVSRENQKSLDRYQSIMDIELGD
jgi:hypothetical protein